MHWLLLLSAILLEVAATSFLKLSSGFSKWMPTFFAVVLFPSSTIIYAFALKKINISIAYPLWSGIGTICMAVVGWLIFKENLSAAKWAFIGVIIIGIAGLHFSK